SNFRLEPYYKETDNFVRFIDDGIASSVSIFNGDSYISPIRWTSTSHYNTIADVRETKKSFWKTAGGALLAVVGVGGVVAGFFTGGLTVAPGLYAINAGVALMSSGIKVNKMNEIYGDLYDQGLRETV